MGNRRKAREICLQLLYDSEFSKKSAAILLHDFSRNPGRLSPDLVQSPYLQEVEQFLAHSLEGVLHNLQEIDQLIEKHSTHWKLSRMAAVDRNILRLSVFELTYCQDIPATVSINEAIEIAKKFGTEESGSFINGILDHVAKDLKRI